MALSVPAFVYAEEAKSDIPAEVSHEQKLDSDKNSSDLQTQNSDTEPFKISTEAEDINITNDLTLAREQVVRFPDNPEAHFVLAVALTRTSKVEETFKELRIARRLTQKLGGPKYFDQMIVEYENILTHSPEDKKVRYHLCWAYYMKAYLLQEYSKRVLTTDKTKAPHRTKEWHKEWVNSISDSKTDSESPEKIADKTIKTPAKKLIPMENVIKKAAPEVVPIIKQCYKKSLANLDELVRQEPKDYWVRLYRAHLNAEYSGDLDSAMKVWSKVRDQNPTIAAPYFFLGEGYLKKGNLKKSLTNVSKAIALRAIGN